MLYYTWDCLLPKARGSSDCSHPMGGGFGSCNRFYHALQPASEEEAEFNAQDGA